MEIRMVITLRITRMRKVHHFKKTERIQSPPPTRNKPMYQRKLRSRTIYSSASQDTSLTACAIFLL